MRDKTSDSGCRSRDDSEGGVKKLGSTVQGNGECGKNILKKSVCRMEKECQK